MRFSSLISIFATATAIGVVDAVSLPPHVPRDVVAFRETHPYSAPDHKCRRKVTIRPSAHEKDDVSEEFKKGILKANNGGTLYLAKGKTYVIGKVLDLTGLNDIHVHLEGEIRVSQQTMAY